MSTACESGCDFDIVDNLCGWTTYNDNADMFGFGQWTGSTETEGTGPDDDFSKPGCKLIYFLWVYGSHHRIQAADVCTCQIIFYPQQ